MLVITVVNMSKHFKKYLGVDGLTHDLSLAQWELSLSRVSVKEEEEEGVGVKKE